MNLSRRHLLRAAIGAAALGWQGLAQTTGKRNMIVRSARPEDYEMPFDGFGDWITPVERFYVRSHHYTPRVEAGEWRLTIGGEAARPLTLTYDELRGMPRSELVSVMECAGNGRGLFEPSMRGIQWTYGAVGNGRWAGTRLRDVLERTGVKPEGRHVLLNGADVPVGTQPDFQRSIPIARAMHEDTLLAWEMNGAPLTPSHGFPVRLVVPGWAGDSWVKWLTGLTLIPTEFDGPYMKTAYRHPGKPVSPGKVVPAAEMHPVESLVIKSVIATPIDGDVITAGPVRVAGAAWSGEARLDKVEVSVDRGRTWREARLGRDDARYGWRLWSFEWTPREPAHYVVMARAWDRDGRTQPLTQEWNPQGYLHNAVQQVAVEYGAPRPEPTQAQPAPAAGPVSRQYQQPRGFRPACLTCHEEDIIMQQRLTRAQWVEEVERMEKWGSRVPPAQRNAIVDYLYRLYGPRPRP